MQILLALPRPGAGMEVTSWSMWDLVPAGVDHVALAGADSLCGIVQARQKEKGGLNEMGALYSGRRRRVQLLNKLNLEKKDQGGSCYQEVAMAIRRLQSKAEMF